MNESLRNKRILAILLVLLMLLGGAGAILSVTDAKESPETQQEETTRIVGVTSVPVDYDAMSQPPDGDGKTQSEERLANR